MIFMTERFKEIISTQKIIDTVNNQEYDGLIDDELLELINKIAETENAMRIKKYNNKEELLNDLYIIEYKLKITKEIHTNYMEIKYRKEYNKIEELIDNIEQEIYDYRLEPCTRKCPFIKKETIGHGWVDSICTLLNLTPSYGSKCKATRKEYDEQMKKI